MSDTETTDRATPRQRPRGRQPRAPDDRHDPHAVDGRGAEGQFGPSRHADGAGAGRLYAVVAIPALPIPSKPDWPNRDRFVLSVGHASMLLYCAAPPRRRRGDRPRRQEDRQGGGQPRRHRAVPPARLEDAGPSRISPHHGRRDDHRPARRRAAAIRSAWRSPSAGWRRATTSTASTCSTTTSTCCAATAT